MIYDENIFLNFKKNFSYPYEIILFYPHITY